MLQEEVYIVRARTPPLPWQEIQAYLESQPLVAPAPNLPGAWVTGEDRATLRSRVDFYTKDGTAPVAGVLIVCDADLIALDIVGAVSGDRIPLVRFLEWLQTRCEIVITENGGSPQPELDRVGVRAFLPDEMRDRLDALYEEAVRREPPPPEPMFEDDEPAEE
jgi:hypothetical protein